MTEIDDDRIKYNRTQIGNIFMAQYIYTMNNVSKLIPPKREILKNINLSFFPGAKIGVLGLNGAGKSTLLRIMAGVDTDYSEKLVHNLALKWAICHKSHNLTQIKTCVVMWKMVCVKL